MSSIPDALMADLASRARSHVRHGARAILGIVGAPGSGKTTFADEFAERLRLGDGGPALDVVRVPMDGFHLADAELARLGRLGRKGAPDTFDVGGYVAMLRRLREDSDEIVYAPAFDRDIEQAVAGSIPVSPTARLVITEGNYLLADGPWRRVLPLLTETWYLEVDEQVRLRRLVVRHERFGKSADAARRWAHGVDQRNAELVEGCRPHADLVVRLDAQPATDRPAPAARPA